jgi:hypothetical protein
MLSNAEDRGRGRRGGFVDIVYKVRGRHNVGGNSGAGYSLLVSLLETGEEGEGRMADRVSIVGPRRVEELCGTLWLGYTALDSGRTRAKRRGQRL